MNKRGHVINGLLLAVGIGFVIEPGLDQATVTTLAAISVPIFLGALVPDVDTVFGVHRKSMHNLPVLAIFLAYPVMFDNLHFVWIGVVSHFALDTLGTRRGIALLYPLTGREYALPVGVSVDSRYSDAVTVLVTAFEIAVFWVIHTSVLALGTDGTFALLWPGI